MTEVDVIICGAGPAGTTCALGLYDAGLNVVLLDKHNFPREKICGDAYNLTVSKILNTISPVFANEFHNLKVGAKTDKIKLVSTRGRIYNVNLQAGFNSLPRVVLDNFLLDMVRKHTQTTIVENSTVTNVSIEKDHVLAITNKGESFKAKVIIGCDGSHSIVQSALTQTRESLTEVWPSVRAYFKNVKEVKSDQLEIYYLDKLPQGYFWIFPSPDGLANVGLGTSKDAIVKHKINMRKIFHEILSQAEFAERFADAEMVGELKGWSLPMGYFEGKLPISGDRVLLCGDAAALVDPATGEGISPAMSSGRHAAEVVKQCFISSDFSANRMKEYDKKVFKKYHRSYSIRSMVSDLTYKIPFLLDVVLFLATVVNRKPKHIG